jgi:hypothetical protein
MTSMRDRIALTIHATNETAVDWPLLERHRVSQDDEGTRENRGRSDAGDGATNDQGHAVVGDSAYQRADLEDEDGDEVNQLDAEEGVESAE